MKDIEIEVKFYVNDIKKIELRLRDMKALLIQPRVHEINYRYDLPDGSLRASGKVIRLRQDTKSILTFKGPSENSNGVLSRTELETTVGDLETAQHIFEALGYSQILTYEKYRTIYEIFGCHIMLDELPFGDFVEIEASDGGSIRNLVAQMSLDIKNAVNRGYASLFEIYNSKYGFTSGDLTFDSFHEKKPSPEELNVRAADN